jgi:GntR family transcriptional repressor for pyruvate dehydrogenase complex
VTDSVTESTADAETVPASPLTASTRAWETVLQRIEADLLSGALVPGEHLPPERALATELGVGRSSVREAIRVLEVLGLIRTQTGSGPQSGAIIIARPSGGMSALMRLQVAAQGFLVTDVVKTRLVIEAAVVAELARVDGGAELREPLELLVAMDDDTLTEAEFLALDQAFHLSLAVASGNEVIASMTAGLRNSVENYVTAGASRLPSWDATSRRLKHEHRGIIAAIEARDPLLASQRIRDHIEAYYAEISAVRDAIAPAV